MDECLLSALCLVVSLDKKLYSTLCLHPGVSVGTGEPLGILTKCCCYPCALASHPVGWGGVETLLYIVSLPGCVSGYR